MAIAFDASAKATAVTATSVTWSHTCTGDNRILFVAVGVPTADTITGVTYNSVAMTLIDKKQMGADRFFYLWYLVAPATGANNIVATSSNSQILRAASASYTGASQTGVPDASTTNNVEGTLSITTSVTTVADNSWLVMVARNSGAEDITAGASTTLRTLIDPDTSEAIFDSNAAKTPAGSHSLVATKTATNRDWITVMASFAPPAPPVVAGGNPMFFSGAVTVG